MTQENQGPSLEDRLLQVGSINQTGRQIEKSKRYSERSQLYQQLAGLLSEGNQKRYKEAYGDIRLSPEEAMRYSLEGLSSRAKDIESQYKENKDKIINKVISSMKDTLKEAKNKSEAASILSNYFISLFDLQELDQNTADEYAQQDVAEDLGVSMNFSARGSIENYRPKHESLQARIYASQYLKDKKNEDGKIIGYELDKKKIAETMNKVIPGATMYTNAMGIEEAKQKEAAEKAKKKK